MKKDKAPKAGGSKESFLSAVKRAVKKFVNFINFKKDPVLKVALLLLILAAGFYFFIAPSAGKAAGSAVGTWHGVTDGIAKGTEAGRQAGLSAKDTEVEVSTKMTQTANLEVLLAELNMTDLYQQGNDYAALLRIRGDGVYSVDLKKTQVSYWEENGNSQLVLTIPEPEFTYYLDDSGLEVVAEYPTSWKPFNGSWSDGYQGYLNSREELEKKVQEQFSGDSSIMARARELARVQVERLARSVCGSQASVTVRFAGEE